jgi:thiamine biosynthesis lipoprotein
MRLTLVIYIIFLAACSSKEPMHNTQSYVFGTLVDITIYGESEDKSQLVADEIIRDFQQLHHHLHAWRPSKLQTLNAAFASGKTPVPIDAAIANMITEATVLSIQSKGAFNPSIGELIEAWGFHNDEFKPTNIDQEKINHLVNAKPQMSDIVIKNGYAFSNNPAVRLDFGGYAKGYALDSALTYLQNQGIKNALVNIGGNIIALGKHGEKPWRVGIQHPRKPNAIATINLESGWAVGTSGDYQRYFELGGKRYCHIIDPAAGYPVQGVQAVTVLIAPSANAGVLSDVASKPIFIAKPQARVDAASMMGIENFLVIESEHHIYISPALSKRLTWLDKDAEKYAVEYDTQTQP